MNNRVREISEHKRDNITVNEANKNVESVRDMSIYIVAVLKLET